MRGNRLWILAGAAVATGVGLAFVLGSRPKIGPSSRVLLIGDSLAVGLGPQLRSLAADDDVPFLGIGVVGSTIRDWAHGARRSELMAALAAFDPNFILVSLGTNDEYLTAASAAAEEDDLDDLLALLAEYGVVVWIGPPTLPKPTNGAVAMIEDTGVPYFSSDRLDIPRAPDGIHPTVAGYGAWAGMLWSWLT